MDLATGSGPERVDKERTGETDTAAVPALFAGESEARDVVDEGLLGLV